MLIVIDDVHWAGRQTLELLRHLVRSGSAGRVMIIATFRDGTADITDALAECLVDLQRSEAVTRVRLGGLDAASVEQYVAGALDQELDGELRVLAAAAAERSGGNAFFLGELWRHLIHHGWWRARTAAGWCVATSVASARRIRSKKSSAGAWRGCRAEPAGRSSWQPSPVSVSNPGCCRPLPACRPTRSVRGSTNWSTAASSSASAAIC
jgi:hypothetical protein